MDHLIQNSINKIKKRAQQIFAPQPQGFNSIGQSRPNIAPPTLGKTFADRAATYRPLAEQFSQNASGKINKQIDRVPLKPFKPLLSINPITPLAKPALKMGVQGLTDTLSGASALRGMEALTSPKRRAEVKKGGLLTRVGAVGDVAGLVPAAGPLGNVDNLVLGAGLVASRKSTPTLNQVAANSRNISEFLTTLRNNQPLLREAIDSIKNTKNSYKTIEDLYSGYKFGKELSIAKQAKASKTFVDDLKLERSINTNLGRRFNLPEFEAVRDNASRLIRVARDERGFIDPTAKVSIRSPKKPRTSQLPQPIAGVKALNMKGNVAKQISEEMNAGVGNTPLANEAGQNLRIQGVVSQPTNPQGRLMPELNNASIEANANPAFSRSGALGQQPNPLQSQTGQLPQQRGNLKVAQSASSDDIIAQARATLKPRSALPQNIDTGMVGLGGQKTIATPQQSKVIVEKSLPKGSSDGIIPPPEEVAKSIPAKIDQFMKDTAGYSTQTPVGGGRGANIYTKTLRAGQSKVTTAIEGKLGSDNKLVRTAASTMQNFFRGLGMSPERARASFTLKGEMGTSNQRAFDVMTSLYDALGSNKKSLERINAVLDPGISKIKVGEVELSASEKAVYTLLKQGFDLTHDISYANKHISTDVYKANMGKYTPRMYDVYEMPTEVSQFVTQGKKIATDLYKSKKELDQWKIDNSLNDPVYALGKRLSQVQTNTAIRKYTDFLGTQSHLISDFEKPGFIKLSDSPAYGELSGKYVLNSAAEDLKGAFFSNQGVQNLYDAFRAYDRLPIRQLQKKLLTVFNPTTNVGNIVSDQVFGFVTGVNPFTLNRNIVRFKSNPAEYKQISDHLMSKGVTGTDITRTDFVNKLSSIDSLAQGVSTKTNKLKAVVQGASDKAQSFYGGTDDVYKAAAFKGLLDKGYSVGEATRRVADGFQNYASVGKFYDLYSKTPVFGQAFIKFQGDLMRIIKNGAVNNPIALISFLGALYGVARLSSKASGETEEDRQTRENRFGAPMIPGLNIPLTWQTPIGEINAARYISPFYANNETTNVLKVLPFVPNIKRDKSGNLDAATTIAQSAGDPLLSTPVQLLVNRDFRGKNIKDPNENKYQPSTLTGQEKLINQLKFAGGNYLPPTANSIIDVKSAADGNPNRYGSTQTVPQAVARVGGIKISQFGPEQAQKQREKEASFNNQAFEGNSKLINAITKDKLTGKIDQATADKRIAEIQKNTPQTTSTSQGGIKDNKIQYIGTNGSLESFDLAPKTSGTGIRAIVDSNWKEKQAAKLWNLEGIDQATKNKVFKDWGIDPKDAGYAALAGYNEDVSAQYLAQESQSHEELINNILTGRVVSITGSQFASNGVITKLNEKGLLSDAEAKALKKIKVDKTGKNLNKAKRLRVKKAPKIKSIKSIKISKGKEIKLNGLKVKKGARLGTYQLKAPKQGKVLKLKVRNLKTS